MPTKRLKTKTTVKYKSKRNKSSWKLTNKLLCGNKTILSNKNQLKQTKIRGIIHVFCSLFFGLKSWLRG